MKHPAGNPIVPSNETGKALDIKDSVTENNREDAVNTFQRACTRLLNPALWHELAGVASASFKLVSENNPDMQKFATLNDYIQIDIPGPGSSAGDGFDWVKIEAIEKNTDTPADESFGLKLRACANPDKKNGGTAHFFTAEATSSFIISRNGNSITASYHGRNEIPNSTEVILADKIRNSIVAAGAMMGFSELQWLALLKGFLQKGMVND